MLMSDAVLASDRTLPTGAGRWLSVLRRYLLFVAGANLVWETLHLPLYTIWQDGTVEELAFAAVHCSGGDVLIALSAHVLALVLVGRGACPGHGYRPVAALALAFRSEEHTSELPSLLRIS